MENQKSNFPNINFNNFWEYNGNNEIITNERILEAELKTGFKFPLGLIELLKSNNGGTPYTIAFPIKNDLYIDHIYITNFIPLGGQFSIDNIDFYSQWNYPSTGLVICDCSSYGMDVIMMDYSKCGPQGDPKIILYDNESEKTILLANNIIEFVEGLILPTFFEPFDEEEDLIE